MNRAPIIEDYDFLNTILKQEHKGKKIICTIGSWDILHRGHIEYLKNAKKAGDVLVVGIDSDTAYLRYKKKSPEFPEEERFAILSAIRFVDYVAPIYDVDLNGNWQYDLVKSINPDLFFCNDQSFSKEQLDSLRKMCEIEIFPLSTAKSVYVTQELKELRIKSTKNDIKMRMKAFQLLATFLALSILTTIFLIIWTAFRGTNLSPDTLDLLIVKTIPETVGMMYIVVKYLFPIKLG